MLGAFWLLGGSDLFSSEFRGQGEFRARMEELRSLAEFLNLINFLVTLVVATMSVTAWHRRIALGRAAVPVRAFFSFGKRHWRMLWQIVKFGFVSILAFFLTLALSIAVSYLAGIIFGGSFEMRSTGHGLSMKSNDPVVVIPGMIILIAVFLPIVSRIALVFPAHAVDEKITLRESWRRTHRNGIRQSIILAIVVVVPTAIFFALAFSLTSAPASGAATIFVFVGIGAVSYFIYLTFLFGLLLSALSIEHRKLKPVA